MPTINDSDLKILVVDDESAIRDLLSGILSESYECTQAHSAESALIRMRQQHFAVVITDIEMSGMNGIELIPHILQHSPDTAIIIVSGQGAISDAVNALRIGAFDYLVKPFDIAQVEAAVLLAAEQYKLKVAAHNDDHAEEYLSDTLTAVANQLV